MTDATERAPLDLEPIKARLATTTAGPWHLFVNRHPNTDGTPWGCVETRRHPAGGAGTVLGKYYWSGYQQKNDADFVAAARSDVPALVAEVEGLRAALATVLARAEHLHEPVTAQEANEINADLDAARAALPTTAAVPA